MIGGDSNVTPVTVVITGSIDGIQIKATASATSTSSRKTAAVPVSRRHTSTPAVRQDARHGAATPILGQNPIISRWPSFLAMSVGAYGGGGRGEGTSTGGPLTAGSLGYHPVSDDL